MCRAQLLVLALGSREGPGAASSLLAQLHRPPLLLPAKGDFLISPPGSFFSSYVKRCFLCLSPVDISCHPISLGQLII